jgi:hypothetical protein
MNLRKSCNILTIHIKYVYNEKKPNMHFVYGFCDGNVRAALRNTSISIQIRSSPTDVFVVVYCSLKETHLSMPPARIDLAHQMWRRKRKC